jgi:hypothetical protein
LRPQSKPLASEDGRPCPSRPTTSHKTVPDKHLYLALESGRLHIIVLIGLSTRREPREQGATTASAGPLCRARYFARFGVWLGLGDRRPHLSPRLLPSDARGRGVRTLATAATVDAPADSDGVVVTPSDCRARFGARGESANPRARLSWRVAVEGGMPRRARHEPWHSIWQLSSPSDKDSASARETMTSARFRLIFVKPEIFWHD